jgi:hypothetical protein
MKLIFFFLTINHFAFGQNASFSADSSYYDGYFGPLNWQWKLKGKTFRFNSKPIAIPLSKSLSFDTLYFRENDSTAWISFLCKLNEPITSVFTYNECCGGFYSTVKNKGIINGSMTIKLSDTLTTKTYLIELGDYSALLTASSPELKINGTRGAMDPNVYRFKITEIQLISNQHSESNLLVLYHDHLQETILYDFKNLVIDTIFLPLSENPVSIEIDVNESTLKVK